jgi:hypothetical protein
MQTLSELQIARARTLLQDGHSLLAVSRIVKCSVVVLQVYGLRERPKPRKKRAALVPRGCAIPGHATKSVSDVTRPPSTRPAISHDANYVQSEN